MKNKVMRAIILNIIFIFNVFGIVFASTTSAKHIDPTKEVWPECPISNKVIFTTIRPDSSLLYWESDPLVTNYDLIFGTDVNSKLSYVASSKVIRFKPSFLQLNADSIYMTRICSTLPRVQSSKKAYLNPLKSFAYLPKYKLDGTCVTVDFGLNNFGTNVNLVYFTNLSDVPGLNGNGTQINQVTKTKYSFTIEDGVNVQAMYITYQIGSHRIYHKVTLDDNLISLPCTDEKLPLLSCGDNISIPPLTGTPLNSFPEGSVFRMSGFPVKVTSIAGNGSFSGTGQISLPFAGGKPVMVTFSGVTINTDKVAISGSINVDSRTLPDDEDFTWDSSTDFVDFCPKEETPPSDVDEEGFGPDGFNKYGFDKDGNHKSGSKYDDNGFDKDGKTKDGSYFDDFGCDRDGKNISGEPCKRDVDKIKIIQFADSIITSSKFITATNQLIDNTKAEIAARKSTLNCQALRDQVINLTSTLGYPQLYVAGDTMKYVKLGMSRRFASEPQKLMVNTNIRNANTILLEDRHVDLFHCDRKELELKEREDYLNQSGVAQDFIEYVESALKNLTPFKFNEIKSDTVAFNKWREGLLNIYLTEKGFPKKYTDGTSKKTMNEMDINPWQSGTMLASEGQNISLTEESYRKEIAWLYNQGFAEINGESRGLYIHEMYENLQAKGLYMMEEDVLMQPIKVLRDTQGTMYYTYFDNIVITPTGASASIYLVFKHNRDGENSKPLVFGAENIGFGPGGIIASGTKLALKSDIQRKIGKYVRLTIKANSGVTISCRGFEKLDFFGKVEICPSAIYPIDSVTLEPYENSTEVFAFDFNTEIASLNDIYLEFANVKPFAFAKAPNIAWTLGKMIFDFSQRKSPPVSGTSTLPKIYTNNFNQNTFTNEWEGVYVDQLTAYLPTQFKTAASGRKSISLNQALIDKDGFTGEIFANNVLPNGNASGWLFGINDFKLTLYQNQIVEGGFGGEIGLPVINKNLGYLATIRRDNSYKIEIKTAGDSTMIFTPFKGTKLSLHPSSRVAAEFTKNDLYLYATLSGDLSMQTDSVVKIPKVLFSNLKVDNKKNFSPGNWGIQGNAQVKILDGFEISLSKFNARKLSEDTVSLDLGMGISLVDNRVTAMGDLNVLGKFKVEEGYHRWEYAGTKLNGVEVDAKIGTTHLLAGLQIFRNDPDFGNGFVGKGTLDIENFGNFGAFAAFGRTSFKYFAVEAFADLNKGIAAGPITFNGFGGGLSYRMDQIITNMREPQSTSFGVTNSSPSASIAGLSGIRYTPNINKGLGLFARTRIELTGSKNAFNGAVLFGMEFTDSWALSKMYLKGAGLLMSKETAGFNYNPESTTAPYNAPVSAFIDLNYNHTARELNGNLGAYLNALALKGIGPGNKMVDGKIFIGKNNWYFHLGTPSTPAGVNFSIAGKSLAQATAYFCLGTDIPDIAPLPANLYQILPKYQNSLVSRKSSRGIAFGSRFQAGFELDAIIARASLIAEAGFDVSLTEYKDFTCQGTNIPIEGINGWYAKAQMYAYLNGKLSVLGKDILNLGVGMVLQGQLPNPTFAQGSAGYSAKTWFGTKQGSFTVKLGNPCIPINPSINDENVDLIDFLAPGDSARNVDVTINPQASLYFTPDEDIEIPGLTNKYRVVVVKDELKSLTTGNQISTTRKTDGSSISTEPLFIPSSGDSVMYTVSVDLYKNGTKLKTETKSIVYKYADGALKNIPIAWINASYPIVNMDNFYADEFRGNGGFISLDRSVQTLLSDKLVMAEFSTSGASFESAVDINGGLMKFGYSSGSFKSGLWNLKLYYKDETGNKQYILSYGFTVSKYKTLTQKLASSDAKLDPLEKNSLVKVDFKYQDIDRCLFNLSTQLSNLTSANGCTGNNFYLDKERVQQITISSTGVIEEKLISGQNSIGQLKGEVGKTLDELARLASPGACTGTYNLVPFQTGCFIKEYSAGTSFQYWYYNVDANETIRQKLNDDARKVPYTLQYSIPGISSAYNVPNDIIYENLKQN